jgi:diadenosine tetraphosphatase ApaH/serine/threonine PP2A family protein phosphatase
MPLAAVLDDKIFCVHGGIAPHARSLAQLRKIKRPLGTYDGQLVADLVWSDPCAESVKCDESRRGLGVQFGVKPLQEWLAALNLKMLLRAHQCIPSGIERFGGDLLYTIFSCSRYEGQTNCCGLMFIDLHLQMELFSLPPLEQIPRADALLQKFIPGECPQEMQILDSLALNVKLFGVAQGRPRFGRPAQTIGDMKKESLLQTFQKMAPAVSCRLAPLRRIPPMGAAGEEKQAK